MVDDDDDNDWWYTRETRDKRDNRDTNDNIDIKDTRLYGSVLWTMLMNPLWITLFLIKSFLLLYKSWFSINSFYNCQNMHFTNIFIKYKNLLD